MTKDIDLISVYGCNYCNSMTCMCDKGEKEYKEWEDESQGVQKDGGGIYIALIMTVVLILGIMSIGIWATLGSMIVGIIISLLIYNLDD